MVIIFFFLNFFKNINFIGIEIYKSGIYNVLFKFQYSILNNIKLIYGNFNYIFKNNIYNNNIDLIKIFYPDPWVKNKHYKRKLINNDSIFLFFFILKKKGKLFILTDCYQYSLFIKKIFSNYYFFIKLYNCFFEIFINSKFNYKNLLLNKVIFNFIYYLNKL